MPPPPLTSKYYSGPTDYELQEQRKENRRQKARVRMAMKRAELKQRSPEEQAQAAARARVYQATYRQKNRDDLRMWEAQRRVEVYKKKFGPEAYQAYAKQRRDRKRWAREKKRAQEQRAAEKAEKRLAQEAHDAEKAARAAGGSSTR